MATKKNPTYVVVKPSAAELRAVKPYLVDKIIRWAHDHEDGVCDLVNDALATVFGRTPAAGWRDSDGFDCAGYDINGYDKDGYDKDNYNEEGYEKWTKVHRVTGRTVDGYDRWGYGEDGFDRHGFNSKGQHRDGIDHFLSIMTEEQKAQMKEALERAGIGSISDLL